MTWLEGESADEEARWWTVSQNNKPATFAGGWECMAKQDGQRDICPPPSALPPNIFGLCKQFLGNTGESDSPTGDVTDSKINTSCSSTLGFACVGWVLKHSKCSFVTRGLRSWFWLDPDTVPEGAVWDSAVRSGASFPCSYHVYPVSGKGEGYCCNI